MNQITMDLTATDVKTFLPANNFQESLRFYKALGWAVEFVAEDDSLAVIALAETRFYLQNYYHKDWAENFMLHITVEDAGAWYRHASAQIISGQFRSARVQKPQEEPYGALVTYVWDPCGVLLHFAQPTEE